MREILEDFKKIRDSSNTANKKESNLSKIGLSLRSNGSTLRLSSKTLFDSSTSVINKFSITNGWEILNFKM